MKCYFCGKEIEKGKGIIFVRSDKKIIYFCSSKCRKNYNLKRVGRRVKWTLEYREFKASQQKVKK